ncbi:hypothetical protein CSUB01_05478 [Colletotrichum sublineola]|uniref:Apple domain-containing protein n=1 Tax=Colletotrichum sublineola TaxID=1173701 RepID=A0A066X989_COLSU|nr:hypothetical protein CSUB01_05478 [Colletotrichum sublineola]
MTSLHPHDNFDSNGGSGRSSDSASLETEKMLKNPDGMHGPEADAVPDGLEVNTGVDYSTAPQAYQSALMPQQPYNGDDQHHHAHTLQTNHTESAYTGNNHHQYSPTSEKKRIEDGTICGLRKPTFWLMVLSSLLLCALIGVAGGMGAMLASKNSEIASLQSLAAANSTSASPTASPTTSSTTSPTASPSVAFDLSQPAETDTPIGLNKCPGSGSQLTYEVPGTNLTFGKDCGTDYLYNDIAQVPAKNFEECVRYCAAFNLQQQSRKGPCRGVVYIFRGEQGEDANWCWMKYNKNTAQKGAKDYTESAWIM